MAKSSNDSREIGEGRSGDIEQDGAASEFDRDQGMWEILMDMIRLYSRAFTASI
jgi:hypothetical protein